jgi:hypothetical protein
MYRTIILPFVLFGCDDMHRLRVLGNRVLRRIFGPKREEVAGGWRIMRNFKTCTFHQMLLG